MGTMISGLVCLVLAALLAASGIKDFNRGLASLKFKWTYPKLEADRNLDPVGFWLLAFAKSLIVLGLAYVGIKLVISR